MANQNSTTSGTWVDSDKESKYLLKLRKKAKSLSIPGFYHLSERQLKKKIECILHR